jgi:hypothetical protein
MPRAVTGNAMPAGRDMCSSCCCLGLLGHQGDSTCAPALYNQTKRERGIQNHMATSLQCYVVHAALSWSALLKVRRDKPYSSSLTAKVQRCLTHLHSVALLWCVPPPPWTSRWYHHSYHLRLRQVCLETAVSANPLPRAAAAAAAWLLLHALVQLVHWAMTLGCCPAWGVVCAHPHREYPCVSACQSWWLHLYHEQ